MPDSETIHVALAFCDPKGTYCRHAAVTIVSIFENTKRSVCIHILHDDTLTHDNRTKLMLMAEEYGQKINLVNIEKIFNEEGIEGCRLFFEGARGMLFRLLLPKITSEEKMIYLDCDIVVNMDIAELWNISLAGCAVAVVRDVWSLEYLEGKPLPWRLDKVWNMLGIKRGEYFNSGVMVLNLKKLRDDYDFLGDVEAFFARYKNCVTLPDQDCLNHIFANDKILIDERFNHIRADGVTEADLFGSIWHMAGGAAKPWVLCTRPFVDDLYWRYLMKTPYCESENELIRTMLHDLSTSPYAHLHSSACVKRVKKQMADNIFRAHIWTVPYIWLRSLTKRTKS